MSAGYNLEGIKSPAVQRFLDRMENAEEDVKRIKAGLAPLYPAIEKMPIPARLSDNLTVSTMHGCPPTKWKASAAISSPNASTTRPSS